MTVSVLSLPNGAMVDISGGTVMTLSKTLYPKSLLSIRTGCFALIIESMLCDC